MQCIGILPGIREITGNMPNVEYNDVTFDSRKVQPGSIYVAIPGINTDGHDYISAAIQNGAAAVIGSKSLPMAPSVPYIRVEDSREAMAWAVAALYGFPSESMTVIGVTGTDGKTTTSIYLYNILRVAGFHTGMISTVSAIINDEELDTGFHVTTPESPDIQRYLAMMRDKGVTHVIIESTSHGLVQKRVSAIDFDIAVVTNITHEHLDFHNSRQAYFEAKGLLFQKLGVNQDRKTPPLAVLNYDDPDCFYGKNTEGDITPICEINDLSIGEHVVRGQVFNLEDKQLKSGKYIITGAITDFTDSIGFKLFVKEDDRNPILEDLKNGGFYRIKGIVDYDDWTREVAIKWL